MSNYDQRIIYNPMKKENICRTNQVSSLIALSFILLLFTTFGSSQQPDRGFKTANSYAASGLETVNTTNGNLMLNIPIASLPAGRGGNPGYTVNLQYNSKLWESHQVTSDLGNPDEYGNTHFASTSLSLSERGGWRLAAAHWGRGYATEAARAVLAHAWDAVGLDEVVSFTAAGNARSRAVMSRLGMKHDPAADFDHPRLPLGHPLRRHVLYRVARPG